MKIWAKLIIDGKNIRDIIYDDGLTMTYENYENMLHEIAYRLDIPTPIAIPIHFRHFAKFNIHKFKQDDFIESFDYDWLELEIVKEDKKKNK